MWEHTHTHTRISLKVKWSASQQLTKKAVWVWCPWGLLGSLKKTITALYGICKPPKVELWVMSAKVLPYTLPLNVARSAPFPSSVQFLSHTTSTSQYVSPNRSHVRTLKAGSISHLSMYLQCLRFKLKTWLDGILQIRSVDMVSIKNVLTFSELARN